MVFRFMIAQRFSLGLRSGEFLGRSSTVIISARKKHCIFLEKYHGALSYWKMPSPFGKCSRSVGSRCVLKVAWYLSEFIILSTGTSRPGPFAVKVLQNIFGGCFGLAGYAPLLLVIPHCASRLMI